MKDEARLVPGLATSFTLVEVGHLLKKSAGDGIVEQRVQAGACTNNPPGDLPWRMPTAG
jgi:hypothetical protein